MCRTRACGKNLARCYISIDIKVLRDVKAGILKLNESDQRLGLMRQGVATTGRAYYTIIALRQG